MHSSVVRCDAWDLEFVELGLTNRLRLSKEVPADATLTVGHSVRAHVAANVALERNIDGEQRREINWGLRIVQERE